MVTKENPGFCPETANARAKIVAPTSALAKSDPFVLGESDPHEEQRSRLESKAIIIIRAEGVPPGKIIVFITIRLTAAICPRARPSQPNIGTLHQPPASGASGGSLLASKPGSFLAS